MRSALLGLAALASLSFPAAAQRAPQAPDAPRPVALAPAPRVAPQAPERDPDRGVIGVFLGPNDTTGRDGARVNGLVDSGPAAAVGLQVGDRILAVDDAPTPNVSALMTAMRGRRAGETLTLTVERDGWRKRVEVELGAAEAPRALEEVEDVEIEEIEEIEVAEEPIEIRELRRLIESRDADGRSRVREEPDGAAPRTRREWIEVRERDGGEPEIRRRVWIDGEEVDPRSIDDDELRRNVREWVERSEDAQRRRRVERDARMDRAERLHRQGLQQERIERERIERRAPQRAEAERRREELEQRRAAMHELRAEVEALRAEVEALRAELHRLRADR